MRRLLAIALVWTLIAGCASSSAETRKRLDVVIFPSTAAAALYVAVDRGFYARAGLDVRLTATPNSQQLMAGLLSNRYQLAAALIDNFVAYRAGQHAVPYDANHDVRVLMGLATARVALVARPEIETISHLHGRRVGVDAPNSGYALVLYQMLAQQGLARTDVELVRSGSTKTRLDVLLQGGIDATLLTPEFAAQAARQGFRIVRDSSDVLPAYMGFVLGADARWAAENSETVRSFLRATLEARHWLAVPSNLPSAAQTLSRELGGTPERMLELLQRLLDEGALITDGDIDSEGLATVLALRRSFGEPATPLEDPQRYIDLSYLPRPAPNRERARR